MVGRWRGKEGGGEEEGLTQGVARSVGPEAKRLAGGGGGGGTCQVLRVRYG